MKKFVRVLFSAMLIFYTLNLFHILHVPLDFSWVGLIATAVGAWLLLERFDLPGWIWLLSFLVITLDACSDIFHLYSRLEIWDRFMHFSGGMFLSFPIILLMNRFRREHHIKVSGVFFLIILLSFVGLLGTLYEILEYSTDKFYFGYPKALGDGPDTVEDLICNLGGGLIGYIVYAIFLSWNLIRGAAIPWIFQRKKVSS